MKPPARRQSASPARWGGALDLVEPPVRQIAPWKSFTDDRGLPPQATGLRSLSTAGRGSRDLLVGHQFGPSACSSACECVRIALDRRSRQREATPDCWVGRGSWVTMSRRSSSHVENTETEDVLLNGGRRARLA
jgi:hypothetical protein